MKKLFLLILGVVALSGCRTITVDQPVIIGKPGSVYQSIDAETSVDVINNTRIVGDILVGETLVYPDVQPQEIKVIGFQCNGFVIWERSRQRMGRTGDRMEYIYFRPKDGGYQVISQQVQVNCGNNYQRRTQFRITNLPRIR